MVQAFSGVKKGSHLLLIGILLAIMPVMVEAVGLGRLKVKSALNEALNAEIPLTSISPREVRTLESGLAPRGAFDALGIERSSHLTQIKFSVSKKLDGSYFLHLTTRSPYQEPFLHLLIQVEWAGGRLSREYTALIDPPYLSSARPSSITAPRLQNPQEDYEPLPDPLADEILKESGKPVAKTEDRAEKLPEPLENLPGPLPEEPTLVKESVAEKEPVIQSTATAPVLPEPIMDEGSEGKSIDQIEAEAFGAGGLGSQKFQEPEPFASDTNEEPLPEPISQSAMAEPEPVNDPYDRGEGLLGPPHIPIISVEPMVNEPIMESPAFWAASGQYKVKRGDTLFEIAQRLRKDKNVSLNQVMMAIYEANPRAFYGKNVNNLNAGKILQMPEQRAVSGRSVAVANRQFKVQYDSWQEHKLKLAQARAPIAVESEPARPTADPAAVAKTDNKAERLAKLKTQRKADKKLAAEAKSKQAVADKTTQEKTRKAELKAKKLAQAEKAKSKAGASAKAKKLAEAEKAKNKADADAKAKKLAEAEKARTVAKEVQKPVAAKPSKTAGARNTEDLLRIVRASMLMAPADSSGQTAETESMQAEIERQMLAKRMDNLEESLESKKLKNEEISSKVGKVKKNIESEKRLIDIENPSLAKNKPVTAADTAPTKPVAVKEAPKKPLKVAEAVKRPVAPRPAPKPTAAETSIIDTILNVLLGNQFVLMLIGGVTLLGLAIMAIYMKRRSKSLADFEESILSADTSTDDLSTDSQDDVGDSGDTSFLSDFSQEGMGNIATDEVDPIAEADVYLAYGRDEQAEEILKDAVSKHPERAELKLKLLEIYNQRNDVSAFETLAEELYASGGASEVWTQVADMGSQLNPENPMFKGDAPSAGMMAAAAEPAAMDMDLGGSNLDMTEIVPGNSMIDDGSGMDDSLDFNIDEPMAGGGTEAVSSPSDGGGLSMGDGLDIGMDMDFTPAAEETPAASGDEDFALDFNMDTSDLGGEEEEESPVVAEPADDNALDFSMDMADMGLETEGESEVAEDDSLSLDTGSDDGDFGLDMGDDSDLDFSSVDTSDSEDEEISALDMVKASGGGLPENEDGSLNFSLSSDDDDDDDAYDLSGDDSGLDLSDDFGMADSGGTEVAEAVDVAEAVGTAAVDIDADENWDEAATKLDLAKAYIDMGDAEGAKSILDEVMTEGNDEQKAQASELAAQI